MALTRLGPNQAVNLSTNTTGTLGVANGGTGLTSGTTDQFLKFTGTTTLASAADNGIIKQVQYVTLDSTTSVTSLSSQTATYLTDQITPTASSSKIEVSMDCTYQISSQDADGRYQANWRVFRSINGGTYSGVYPENNNTNFAYGYDEQDNTFFQGHLHINFMDTPNTTDAVDYKLYVTLQEGEAISIGQNQYSSVILKEISA